MRNYGLKGAKKIPPMPPCAPAARSVRGNTPKPKPCTEHNGETISVTGNAASNAEKAIAIFMTGFLCGFMAILPIWYALTHA